MFTLCPHRYRHPMLIAYKGVQYYIFNEFRIILNEWFAYLSQWIYSLAAWYFSGCFVEHWFCGFSIGLYIRLYNVVGIYQMKCQSNFIHFYLVFSLIFFLMLNQVLTREFCISCLLSMTFEYYSLISLNYTFSQWIYLFEIYQWIYLFEITTLLTVISMQTARQSAHSIPLWTSEHTV